MMVANPSEPTTGSSRSIHLFTIGFTQKSARQFFTTLIDAGVQRVLDVRLNNVSQLAAFAKRGDLEYFLDALGKIGYVHLPILAPTQEILDALKKRRGDWATYERDFLALLAERRVEEHLDPALLDGGCLLCSEATPDQCHRRLVVEYLSARWGNVTVQHL